MGSGCKSINPCVSGSIPDAAASLREAAIITHVVLLVPPAPKGTLALESLRGGRRHSTELTN
jgi:hypothetical protein